MRVLIADDNAVSRRILESTLVRLGHVVIPVENGPDAVAALLDPSGPRLAILDWMMPGLDGPGVVREIRQRAGSYVYMILLTARDSSVYMVPGLDAGADDFLTKPFDNAELHARLRSGVRVLTLQEDLLKTQAQLSALARRDHLTGVGNRRAILDELARELNRSRHERRPLAIVMGDLDGFKLVNDRHGHAAGDAVLRESAIAMQTQLREYDFIARYGGEEFLIVLPGCDLEMGVAISERLRAIVAVEPVRFEGTEIAVTISLGCAWTGATGHDPDTLIRAADEALYRAKAQGRNRVECARA